MIVKTDLTTEADIKHYKDALEKSPFDTSASFLRHILKVHFLRSSQSEKQVFKVPAPKKVADTKLETRSIYLPIFLDREVEKRATYYGFKTVVWIRNLIAANLTKKPILVEPQIDAVLASNRELAAIGRNLNQIVKIMNQSADMKLRDRVTYDHILQIREGIETQKKEIYKMVAESQNVWKVD
jgi:hypothetical protein|tara:strand:+ start:4494 stop:5042 length:549 start_codon:yes stop_codon:yes gene_type:complete